MNHYKYSLQLTTATVWKVAHVNTHSNMARMLWNNADMMDLHSVHTQFTSSDATRCNSIVARKKFSHQWQLKDSYQYIA